MPITSEEITDALGLSELSDEQQTYISALVAKYTEAEQGIDKVKEAAAKKARLQANRTKELLEKLLNADSPDELDLGDSAPDEKDPLAGIAALLKQHKESELSGKSELQQRLEELQAYNAEQEKKLKAHETKTAEMLKKMQDAETARAEKELYDFAVSKYMDKVNEDMRPIVWEKTRPMVSQVNGALIVKDADGTPRMLGDKVADYSALLGDMRTGGKEFGLNLASAFTPVDKDTEPGNTRSPLHPNAGQTTEEPDKLFQRLYGGKGL